MLWALVALVALTSAAEARSLVIGDSIAHGVRMACRCAGITREGAPPSEVLGMVQRAGIRPGDVVLLSTGASNNPADVVSIAAQIRALRDTGARVRVLGVGPRFSRHNPRLIALTSHYGAAFIPLGQTGPDGVHPPASRYRSLARGLR
jgi:hypothetical protein